MATDVAAGHARIRPAFGVRARRRYAWMADAAGVAAASTMVALAAMWFANGAMTDLGSLGGFALAIGRLTGLIAADLLLIQVLLMARIPFVERAWGQDVLTRQHRIAGEASFFLMIAHIVLITIGYVQAGTLTLWGQIEDFVVNYPGMMLAVAGTVALFGVAATSVRVVRRRMRYESWHLLHLYAYVGVALVLPHELWTGQGFLASQAMTVFWWTLWGLAAGAIVAFRLALPLGRSLAHRLVVDRVVVEAPGVQSVIIRGRRMSRLNAQPGQYFSWRFLTGAGWMRAHPFSVSAVPGGDRVRITMRTSGDEARRLSGLRAGTRVLVEGPYGSLTADRRLRRDVLMIAAGVGITPLRGLAEQIATEPPAAGPGGRLRPSVVVLHRVSALEGAVFTREWEELAAQCGIGFGRLVGPRDPAGGWLPAAPYPVDEAQYLRRLVPDIGERSVYLCGPRPWMTAVRRTLHNLGIDPAAVHREDFDTSYRRDGAHPRRLARHAAEPEARPGPSRGAGHGSERTATPKEPTMRRITIAIMSTISALVLLFSYRTSLGDGVAAQPADPAHIVAAGPTGASAGAAGDSEAGGADSGGADSGESDSREADGGGAGSGGAASTTPPGGAASGTADPAPTTPSASRSTDSVVADGAIETTPYGPVQVEVTVSGGRITAVTALQHPFEERRSQEINAVALPQLQSEVLAAQSARIDGVSGATATTEGYIASLQSALDVAHFSA